MSVDHVRSRVPAQAEDLLSRDAGDGVLPVFSASDALHSRVKADSASLPMLTTRKPAVEESRDKQQEAISSQCSLSTQ
jgi:hypothetical protein